MDYRGRIASFENDEDAVSDYRTALTNAEAEGPGGAKTARERAVEAIEGCRQVRLALHPCRPEPLRDFAEAVRDRIEEAGLQFVDAATIDDDDDERRRALRADDVSAVRALVSAVEIVENIHDDAVAGGIRREPSCLVCAVRAPAVGWPPHHTECVVLRARQQFGLVGPLRVGYPPAPERHRAAKGDR